MSPEEAAARAKRRLLQFDAVIPVENIFDGFKYLSYVMNLPLPETIENVRSAKSVCGPFMSNFPAEYAAACGKSESGTGLEKSIDCTGKHHACYAAKHKLMKEQQPALYALAASGHSPQVSNYVRQRNSMDDELHELSKVPWQKQWSLLLRQEGRPTCEIECSAAHIKNLCTANYESTKEKLAETHAAFDLKGGCDLRWDSDDVFSEAGPVKMDCKPKYTEGYTRCFSPSTYAEGTPGFLSWG